MRLVALMGGEIRVQSEVGGGSCFQFEIRVKKARGFSKIIPPWNAAAVNGQAVLVVDDNATNRRVLTELLGAWQACVTAVASAAEALTELRRAAAASQPYALLLVDAIMPEMDGFTLVECIRAEPDLAGPATIMLTSADRQGDSVRCRQLGLAAYLVKPVKAAELQRAIAAALAAQPAVRAMVPALSAPAKLEAHPVRALRILLAEDNAINQRVAIKMLQKHGHTVEVAANGKLALAALEQDTFDLVLMDVQMPEMGGFEATAAIRAGEQRDGGHIPVIAMTAHAMKGDRERCLEAGMDEYVSKPIQAPELQRAIISVRNVSESAWSKTALAPLPTAAPPKARLA